MHNFFLATLAACVVSASAAIAASDSDCEAKWKQADANGDDVLSAAEAIRYAAAIRVSGETVPAGSTITKELFLERCKADAFAEAKTDPGAPLEGANSFTEGQAQDRVLAAGFSDVSALTKDDKGIWRGTAKKGGASVQVAVDYKGNVVAN